MASVAACLSIVCCVPSQPFGCAMTKTASPLRSSQAFEMVMCVSRMNFSAHVIKYARKSPKTSSRLRFTGRGGRWVACKAVGIVLGRIRTLNLRGSSGYNRMRVLNDLPFDLHPFFIFDLLDVLIQQSLGSCSAESTFLIVAQYGRNLGRSRGMFLTRIPKDIELDEINLSLTRLNCY